MKHSKVVGQGYYVPDSVVTNDDLSKIMDTSDAWIQERTGIQERRHLGRHSGQTTRDLGYKAAMKALGSANLKPSDLDFIVFATLSPDYFFPGNGVLLQQDLGCDTIGALDVRNQCSGFIYALSTADAFIKTGMYKTILVVGAEHHSVGLDMTTRGRGVSVIFGDGAGAVILQANDQSKGILSCNMGSQGEHAEELAVLFPGSKYGWADEYNDAHITPEIIYPVMNGTFVFKHAVVRFAEAIDKVLLDAGKTMDDVSLLIPHQANLRISQFIQKKYGLSDDRVFNNIQKYGNTTAGSIPIAFAEAMEAGRIKEGDLVCMAAFGSGFTWGAVLIQF
ncbi:MAG: 3-oxoacyl-ACP synthase [Flavobacteriaceae bacterium]|nr:MAG: 3-oxoacyl-ACP synthase [Flavobacteriaceae bacterium]